MTVPVAGPMLVDPGILGNDAGIVWPVAPPCVMVGGEPAPDVWSLAEPAD